MRAVATLAAMAFLASCERNNPAYRGPAGGVAPESPDQADEAEPPRSDAAAAAGVDGRTETVSPDAMTLDTRVTGAVAPAARSALLVVGNVNLAPIDVQGTERLAALGFKVTVKLDADAVTADAQNMSVVILSGSSASNNVRDKFRRVEVPVICYDSWDFPLMGLTGQTAATDYGRDDNDAAPDTRLALTVSHPLGANLSGLVEISDRAMGLAWGRPLASATSVASLVGDPTRIAIFGYAQGARLHDGTMAPARRVGSFARNPNGARLSPRGLQLFDAAVTWATSP